MESRMREICTSGLTRGKEVGGHWTCASHPVASLPTLLDTILRSMPFFDSMRGWFLTNRMGAWALVFQPRIPWESLLEAIVSLRADHERAHLHTGRPASSSARTTPPERICYSAPPNEMKNPAGSRLPAGSICHQLR